MLAFVRLGPDGIANVVVRDLSSGEERVLTTGVNTDVVTPISPRRESNHA